MLRMILREKKTPTVFLIDLMSSLFEVLVLHSPNYKQAYNLRVRIVFTDTHIHTQCKCVKS